MASCLLSSERKFTELLTALVNQNPCVFAYDVFGNFKIFVGFLDQFHENILISEIFCEIESTITLSLISVLQSSI